MNRKNIYIALLFLAPNLIGFLTFTLGPVLMSLGGSFTTWSLRPTVPTVFIGLENYRELLTDPDFWFYFYNTFYFLMPLPLSIFSSLCLASFLCQKLEFRGAKGRTTAGLVCGFLTGISAIILWLFVNPSLGFVMGFLCIVGTLGFILGPTTYRTVFYLPHFAAGAGTIILWLQLYNPNFGLINQVLEGVFHFLHLDINPPRWLASTKSLLGFLPLPDHFSDSGFGIGAREAIIMMSLWMGLGGKQMILYIASISNISPDLYEAADVDGANGLQRFIHITIPSVAPTTFFLIIMGVIHGLQGGFETARIMTEGGPAGMTTTLTYYIYTQGFERLDLGYGAAVAWVLFIIIFGLTLVNWRYGNRGND